MASIFHRWRDRRRPRSDAELAAERADLARDYRFVFGSEPGQRVLADLLRRGGVMLDPYDAHPTNAAYAMGKRRLALDIIETINADQAAQEALAITGETEELFRNV